ncbi:hypothetical protein H9L39_08550 [Fusarium oxysporum f. sp. albedinis]|jgi:hypothetical protein|nr:hypothetical protein H9L39_08550 [Fusarium oxysporum f. sp. albedinis]
MEDNGSELKFVSPNGDIITSGDDTRAEGGGENRETVKAMEGKPPGSAFLNDARSRSVTSSRVQILGRIQSNELSPYSFTL